MTRQYEKPLTAPLGDHPELLRLKRLGYGIPQRQKPQQFGHNTNEGQTYSAHGKESIMGTGEEATTHKGRGHRHDRDEQSDMEARIRAEVQEEFRRSAEADVSKMRGHANHDAERRAIEAERRALEDFRHAIESEKQALKAQAQQAAQAAAQAAQLRQQPGQFFSPAEIQAAVSSSVEVGMHNAIERVARDKNIRLNLFQRGRLEKLEDAGWTAVGVAVGVSVGTGIVYMAGKAFGAPTP